MAHTGPWHPCHGSLLRATGHGEVWADWSPTAKFSQFGWRCTTNESDYSHKTHIGNWNEEQCDIQNIVQPKPLPSQIAPVQLPSLCCSAVCPFMYAHCFETTYSSDYNKGKHQRTRRFKREPHWFPGHQPELEPPPFKQTEQSCYMIDYRPPHGNISSAGVQGSEEEQEGAGKAIANLQTVSPE
ncbi:cilia- and flagella-associated protein 68 [Rhea pennata]|uniref:cilia- and flagella-associated protein 68 n=1 Tax=Rhea pennata TaxID=8795 RepID=UPI002E2630E5